MIFRNLGFTSLLIILVTFTHSAYAKNLPSPRIIGGSDVTVPYEWMVSIQVKSNNARFCGGALIQSHWVLTAAHCVQYEDPANLQVVVGAIDTNPSSTEGERLNVQYIAVHPDYGQDFSLDNDIALLKLESGSTKTPVELASTAETDSLVAGMSQLLVMGWGLINTNEDFPIVDSDILQSVEIPLATGADCFGTFPEFPFAAYQEGVLCAGQSNSTTDACNGDSGGPLLYEFAGELKHVGIVSFGSSACNTYGGYTNTSHYLEWINETTEGLFISGPAHFYYLWPGETETSQFELVNNDDASVEINSFSINGANFDLFSIRNNQCGDTLAANSSCSFEVQASASNLNGLLTATVNVGTSSLTTPNLSLEIFSFSLRSQDFSDEMDDNRFSWLTGGDADWGVNFTASKGTSSLATVDLDDSEESLLVANFSSDINKVYVDIKVSSEADFDELLVYVGTSLVGRYSGTMDWTTVSFDVPSGTDQIIFRYVKDSSISEGADRAWIDNIRTEAKSNDKDNENEGGLGSGSGGGGGGSIGFLSIAALMIVALRRKVLNS